MTIVPCAYSIIGIQNENPVSQLQNFPMITCKCFQWHWQHLKGLGRWKRVRTFDTFFVCGGHPFFWHVLAQLICVWSGASLVWQGRLSLIVVCGELYVGAAQSLAGHLPNLPKRPGLTRSLPHIFMRHTQCQRADSVKKSATVAATPEFSTPSPCLI